MFYGFLDDEKVSLVSTVVQVCNQHNMFAVYLLCTDMIFPVQASNNHIMLASFPSVVYSFLTLSQLAWEHLLLWFD